MDSHDFPTIGQPKQAPGQVTVEYTNVINEVAGASQQIILIAQFKSRENSSVHEFVAWLCEILQGARVRSLHIEQRSVQLRIDDIVRKIMVMHSGYSEIWE
jgi:hypothetical protein